MGGTLVLHIGTEKTGSTTIQRSLAANRELLGTDGVDIVPAPAVRGLLGCGLRTKGHPDPAPLRRSLDRHHMTIVSSELFQSRLARSRQVQRLASFCRSLGASEIRIIVYLRRPAELVNSMVATAARINAGRKQSILSVYMRNICDHKSTLQRWSQSFGREAVRARLFNPSAFHDADLVSDFLQAAGAAKSPHFKGTTPHNESLSWDGVLVARALHKCLAEQFTDWQLEDRNRLGAKLCLRKVSEAYKEPRLLLDPVIWRLFDDEFSTDSEWLRENWFPKEEAIFDTGIPSAANFPTLDALGARQAAEKILQEERDFVSAWIKKKPATKQMPNR